MIDNTDIIARELDEELFSKEIYWRMSREYSKLHGRSRRADVDLQFRGLISESCSSCFYDVFIPMRDNEKQSELVYLILYKILIFLMTKLDNVDYLSYGSYVIEALANKHTKYDEKDKGCEYYTNKVQEFRKELSQFLLKELFSEKYYPDPHFMWEIYAGDIFDHLCFFEDNGLDLTYIILMIAILFLETIKNNPDYIAFDKIITNKEENVECFYNQHKEAIHNFGKDMDKFFTKRLTPFDQQSIKLLLDDIEKSKEAINAIMEPYLAKFRQQ
jgi:hypothetical protein